MKAKLFFALVPVFLFGCPQHIPPPNPPPDTDWCGKMCSHLKELGCEEGESVYNNDLPGKKDVPNQSCEDFCVELQDKGFFVNPRCVSYVESCDDIEDIRQKEPKTCKPQP